MIRRIVIVFLTIAVIVGWIPPMGGAVVTVPVFLDGKPLSDMAVLTQNRTLLPFRALFEPLGATVEWDPATRTVHATKAALSLTLAIGDRVAYVNGNPVSLDVPAQIIHDRTMVPVRFVAETLGATVGWDALSRTVIVSTAEKTPVTVRRVTDELALEIERDQGAMTLRLAGIAFPQTAHPTAEEEAFRRERRAFLEQWVGKSVLVEWAGDADNAQGPADGYVFRPDGIFLNAELVSRGYASRAAHAADVAWDELLVHLQRDAERGKRGYWGLSEKGAGNVGGGAFVPATPTSGVFGGKAFDATRKATLQVPGATLQLVSRSGKTYTHLVKEQAVWRVVKAGRVWGTLTVAQYAVRNGDYVYLLRYEPAWTGSTPLAVHLTLAGSVKPFTERHTEYSGTIDTSTAVWKPPQPVKGALPKYTAFVENADYSLWVSLANVYRPLANQTMEERYEKVRPIQVQQAGTATTLVITFPQEKGYRGEQWSVVSTRSLVDWNHPTAPSTARIADLNRARKFSFDGVYYRTPTSYVPYTPNNFYRNPAFHVGQAFLNASGGRLFETFGLVLLATAVETQTKDGFWPVSTRSEWLYNDYGIDAGYYDTRWSTDAARFLLSGYERYKDPAMLEAAKRYGEYFLRFAQANHFPTSATGLLVCDYGHPTKPHRKTHVSLNHHLAEMNFLYELYLVTKDKRYLSFAERMRQGVKDTAPEWRRADGDLHYAYLPDGTYGMQDYPTLTLNDLKDSQRLIERVTGQPDPDVQQLIEWKTEFARKKGYIP